MGFPGQGPGRYQPHSPLPKALMLVGQDWMLRGSLEPLFLAAALFRCFKVLPQTILSCVTESLLENCKCLVMKSFIFHFVGLF